MWIKYLLLFTCILSCNVAELTGIAKTEIGDNFGRDLKPGLIAFWRLNEPGSTDTRFDSIGGNNLIATDFAYSVQGKVGNAVDCQISTDDAASGILHNSSPSVSISNTQDYTIAFWAQDNDGAGGGYAVDFDQTTIRVASGGGFFEISTDADATHFPFANNFPSGQWKHFTFVFNGIGDYVDYYVDGSFVESIGVSDSSVVPAQLSLCSLSIAGQNFPGYLDSVGLWERALSIEDIKALANGNNNVD